MATVTERLRLIIDADSKGATSTIRGVGDATEQASLKTRLLSSAHDQLGVSAMGMGTALKGAGIAAAGVAAVGLAKWAADGVGTVVDLTDQIRDFQRVTGASAEDSSRWVAALDDMEVSAAAGEKAAFKLAREIGEGGKKLAEFGVEIAKNNDGTTDLSGTLLNVSEAYTETSDAGERAALVQAAFGRGGKELIPILEKGKKGIEELFQSAEEGHQIFSQEDLQNAREFELALDNLQDQLRGFQIEAGKAVIPVVSEMTTRMTQGVQIFEAAGDAAGGLGGKMSELGLNTLKTMSGFNLMSSAADGLGEAFGIGGDEADSFADKQEKVKDATEKLADVQADQSSTTKEVNAAQKELRVASSDLKGVQDELAGSLDTVNESLQTQAEKAYEAAQADLLAGSKQLGMEKALRATGDAFKEFSSSAYDSAVAGDTLDEATSRLARNHEDLVGAVLAATTAARDKALADNAGEDAAVAQKAATDAQRYTLLLLEQQFPGLRSQVEDYVGALYSIPPARSTAVWVEGLDTSLQNVRTLERTLERIAGNTYVANVTVGTYPFLP